MKNHCLEWKDRLLEAALANSEGANAELQNHLSQCPDCAAELAGLRARRERLEWLLPRLANAAEPSRDLRARIVVAAEAATGRRHSVLWRVWAAAGTAAIIMVMIGLVVVRGIVRRTRVREAELRGAQALAQWRAPTDIFLRTPGEELLNSMPKFGGSYVSVPIAKQEGGGK
jgi:anti-sigma factor RsiW